MPMLPATSPLFSQADLGGLRLRNRVVMAPMTRNRAHPDGSPSALMVRYYAQRAQAGLIVTEGTAPSRTGRGYLRMPGLYLDDHVGPWRRITDAVHAAGGRIFVQLMHVGRVAHSANLDGRPPVGPSDTRASGEILTARGRQPIEAPQPLTESGIASVVAEYRRAAEMAADAGFDGVEIHAGSGYLPMQFLLPGVNQRTDAWGGSLDNRARFLLDVVDAAASVLAPGRVGIRLTPESTFNDVHDADPAATCSHLAHELSRRRVGYLHVQDVAVSGWNVLGHLRPRFAGVLIANGGYDRERADRDLGANRADLISFGWPFIANPDLPERLRLGQPLAEADESTLYSGEERGYTDYPLAERSAEMN
ncbi:MAG: alkene reductase [Betaproteobacteria bacterium]